MKLWLYVRAYRVLSYQSITLSLPQLNSTQSFFDQPKQGFLVVSLCDGGVRARRHIVVAKLRFAAVQLLLLLLLLLLWGGIEEDWAVLEDALVLLLLLLLLVDTWVLLVHLHLIMATVWCYQLIVVVSTASTHVYARVVDGGHVVLGFGCHGDWLIVSVLGSATRGLNLDIRGLVLDLELDLLLVVLLVSDGWGWP